MGEPARDALSEAFFRIEGTGCAAVPRYEAWTTDLLMAMYVEVTKVKEELEGRLSEAELRLGEMEPLVVNYFRDETKQRETRRGRTISLVNEEWPRTVFEDLLEGVAPTEQAREDLSKETLDRVKEAARVRLVEALRADPSTAHLVKLTANHQTVRSFLLKDCRRDPETLKIVVPEHLEGKLGVSEVSRARVTKG